MADSQAVPQRVAFIQLEKFDATTNEFTGTMVTETPDEAGEIFDYDTSKPEVKKWIAAARKRSGEKSLGNVREMHGLKAAGKLTRVDFDDKARKIRVQGLVVDAETRLKIAEGVLTGLSIGGKYLKTWPDPTNPQHIRYTAGLTELSFVDSPCIEDATLNLTTAAGSKVLKFSRTVPAGAGDVETIDVELDDADEDRQLAKALGDKPLERPRATERTPTLVKRTGTQTPATEDATMTKDELVAAAVEAGKAAAAAERAAKAAKRGAKLKKWVARAQPAKVDYESLSKPERAEFRARWRADRALGKLAKVLGGSADADSARAIVGPLGASDEGKAGRDGEALTKASDADIAARTAARTRDAL